MGTFGKIAGKVALVLVGSIALGYAEYRFKGGEPLHIAYKKAMAERQKAAMIAAAKKGKVIKAEGTVG